MRLNAHPHGFVSLRVVSTAGGVVGSLLSVPVGVWHAAMSGAMVSRATSSRRRESITMYSGKGMPSDTGTLPVSPHHGGQTPDTVGNDFLAAPSTILTSPQT